MKATSIALFFLFFCAPAFADDAAKPASSPPPSEVVVHVNPGDTWEFELRDGLTDQLKSTVHQTVTEIAPSGEISLRNRINAAKTQQESTGLITYDRNWRLKEDAAWRNAPPNETTGIPDGLALNKTWNYTRKATRLSPPADFKFAGTGKVVAWEQVTLPDGASYDAYRIEFSEAVTPVVNNRKFEFKFVEWYAPSVNHFVKRAFESRQSGKLIDQGVELMTSYEPKS